MRLLLSSLFLCAFALVGCQKDTAPCEEIPKENYSLLAAPSPQAATRISSNFKACRKRNKRHLKDALFSVGLSVLHGLGTEKNPAKAFSWLKASADKGHEGARMLIGEMFKTGYGAPKDLEQAKLYLPN